MVKPAAMALALALTSVALPQAVYAQSYTFSNVQIEGNERIEPETILTYAGISQGQSVSGGDLNAAYQRLQNSGLFESVDITPQGGTLVINVQEYPTINIINFEGNKRLKDENLAGLIGSETRKIYNPATVEADARKIAQAYAESGRINARVDPKVIRRSGNRVDIAFEIREGKVTEVERISFTGNRSYSDRRLRNVLATKQAGFLRQFIQRDTFMGDRVAVDRQLLSDFYRSRGFVDVQVSGVSSELTRERDSFFVTFNIQEGQQFNFGQISTVSEVPGVDVAEFEDLAKIRSGKTYSPAAVDLAVTRMEEKALRLGLNFVRVDPRVTRNPRTQTLDIQFALVRGERVFVERIDIEGNTTTLDRVVRREFQTVEGDPFNPREIRRSAERIRALGYFSNANVESRPGSAPDQVVVDVNVEEQPTGALSFGASYGQDAGLGLQIQLSERNFLGRGQQLSASIGTTSSNQRSSFNFVEPFFLGRDLALGFNIYHTVSEDDNSDYNVRRSGLSPSIEFPVAENSRVQLRYSLSRDELYGVNALNDQGTATRDDDTGSSPILSREEGALWKSSVGYSYIYDTRTTGLDPRFGYYLRFDQDFAGLGGDVESVTTTALATAERKVWNEEVTLRAEFEGGIIASKAGGNDTILERFSGNGKMRGFESNGYGPRDTAAPNQDALGGKYFAVARLEAEFPLGLPEEYNINGGLFMDMGSVWGLDDKTGAYGTEVDDGFNLRSAIGFAVMWSSPIGPLRFNFSKAIAKEDYDEEQTFDMTVSTRF
ncbi:outer membrane protein assembly factor BamA [Thioclava sp. SK-1]|nr:outer membrane protein assembly factor BamA [Thioclava sp. SK-1]